VIASCIVVLRVALTVLVPEEQYIITKQINIPNRVVIKGELSVCIVMVAAVYFNCSVPP
jgi:hypothetical protein